MAKVKFEVKVSQNQQQLKRCFNIVSNLQAEISKTLWKGGKETVKTIIDQSNEPKSGIVYKIKKGGRMVQHTASSDSETSANATGRKNKATEFRVSGNTLQIGVKKDADYAKYIEEGTKNMKARKDLQVGLQKNEKKIAEDLYDAVVKKIENNLKNE